MNKIFKRIKNGLKERTEVIVGSTGYEKFVIITSPRTGSNLLISLLSSNRNVYAYGELFNHIKQKSCEQIWRETFTKKLPWIKTVGFKIFYDHPLASEDEEVWDFIKDDKEIKIIHLIRENTLRSNLSLCK